MEKLAKKLSLSSATMRGLAQLKPSEDPYAADLLANEIGMVSGLPRDIAPLVSGTHVARTQAMASELVAENRRLELENTNLGSRNRTLKRKIEDLEKELSVLYDNAGKFE